MILLNKSKNNTIKSFVFFGILLFCVIQLNCSKTLTVDDVIKKNIDARGGAEKWAKVENITMDGIYVSFSDPEPFKVWRQLPDFYRFDSKRINQEVIHGYDGQNAKQYLTCDNYCLIMLFLLQHSPHVLS